MAPQQTPPAADLVSLTKLNVQFSTEPRYTEHSYRATSSLGKTSLFTERWIEEEKKLGRGSYGKVHLEQCIYGQRIGQLRAVKRMEKPHGYNCYRELEALAFFSFQKYEGYFVKSLGWYESEEDIFIAMEYLQYGDLMRHLEVPLSEQEGRLIVSQVLEGLECMHDQGFTHRDLKPGNLLVASPGPDWWIKIADFGFAKRALEGDTALRTIAGTPSFVAPDIFGYGALSDDMDTPYTSAVDVWSTGVIAFLILTGKLYFPEPRRIALYVQGRPNTPLETLFSATVSTAGCNLIKRLMSPHATDRPSAKEARGDPWFSAIALAESLHAVNDAAPSVPKTGEDASRALQATERPPDMSPTESPVQQEASNRATTQGSDEIAAQPDNTSLPVLPQYASVIRSNAQSIAGGEVVATVSMERRTGMRAEEIPRANISTTVERPENPSAEGHMCATSSTGPAINAIAPSIKATEWTVTLRDPGSSSLSSPRKMTTVKTTINLRNTPVYALCFSRDGMSLATSYRGGIDVWDVSTRKMILRIKEDEQLQRPEPARALAFAPKGRFLASAQSNGPIKVWNVASGQLGGLLEQQIKLNEVNVHERIEAIKFSQTGRLLAVAALHCEYSDPDVAGCGIVEAFKVLVKRSQSELHILKTNQARDIAISPDERMVAWASSQGQITIWEVIKGTQVKRMQLKINLSYVKLKPVMPFR